MNATAPHITNLLRQARAGNHQAESLLARAVYPELRDIARRFMASERPFHTLQPTALVNEAYVRIMGGVEIDWNDRAHFMAVAARQMRRVLADHGREYRAAKRGGGSKLQLDEGYDVANAGFEHASEIDLLLQRLQKVDPDAARVTELKFFGGLTDQEVAAALNTNHKKVRRHWEFARAWLQHRLADTPQGGEGI